MTAHSSQSSRYVVRFRSAFAKAYSHVPYNASDMRESQRSRLTRQIMHARRVLFRSFQTSKMWWRILSRSFNRGDADKARSFIRTCTKTPAGSFDMYICVSEAGRAQLRPMVLPHPRLSRSRRALGFPNHGHAQG